MSGAVRSGHPFTDGPKDKHHPVPNEIAEVISQKETPAFGGGFFLANHFCYFVRHMVMPAFKPMDEGVS